MTPSLATVDTIAHPSAEKGQKSLFGKVYRQGDMLQDSLAQKARPRLPMTALFQLYLDIRRNASISHTALVIHLCTLWLCNKHWINSLVVGWGKAVHFTEHLLSCMWQYWEVDAGLVLEIQTRFWPPSGSLLASLQLDGFVQRVHFLVVDLGNLTFLFLSSPLKIG